MGLQELDTTEATLHSMLGISIPEWLVFINFLSDNVGKLSMNYPHVSFDIFRFLCTNSYDLYIRTVLFLFFLNMFSFLLFLPYCTA